MLQQVLFGPMADNRSADFADLGWGERIVMSAIVGIILIIGIYPNLIFNILNSMQS